MHDLCRFLRVSGVTHFATLQQKTNHRSCSRCQADPEAAKEAHRAWFRQFWGNRPAIDEDEDVEGDEDNEAKENGDEETEEDELKTARPVRAHLTQSRAVHGQLDGQQEDDEEEDPTSLRNRGSCKNWPQCDNGGTLLDMHKSKSWASSFANVFNYRY